MESKTSSRKKSFNLMLLVFIFTLIIGITTIIIITINKQKNKTSDSNNNQQNQEAQIPVNLIPTNIEDYDTIISSDTQNIEDSQNENTEHSNDTENEQIPSPIAEEKKYTINNHTYTIQNDIQSSQITNSLETALLLDYINYDFKIIYGEKNNINFEELKNSPDLRHKLESVYNLKIQNDIKYGIIKEHKMIICTTTDSIGKAYFIITPINDNQITFSKIYNKKDNQSLISDLSLPIDELIKIIPINNN